MARSCKQLPSDIPNAIIGWIPSIASSLTPHLTLKPPPLELRLITVHNHVENFLTCDHAVCRIVDISISADHRYAKVANSVTVSDRAWIRQYHERNVRTR